MPDQLARRLAPYSTAPTPVVKPPHYSGRTV